MAITNQQIIDYLLTNPSDAEVAKAMETFQVSPADIAKATGTSEGEIAARVAATLPPNQAVLLGDTYVQAVNQVTGSGQDQQVGGLENVITYKAGENQAGGGYQQYTPTGELQRTGVQQEVNAGQDFLKFLGGSALLFGGLGGGFDSLFGGPAAGNGAFLGEGVASGIPAFDAAYTAAGGVFNPAFGLPVGNGAFLGEGVPTGIPASDTAFLNAGGTFDPAFALGADGLVGTPLVTPPATTTPITTTTPPVTTTPVTTPPVVTTPVVTPPVVTPPFVTPSINDVIKTIGTIATVAAIPSIVSPKTTAPTGFDIVPIPTDWKTPNKPTTAPYTALSPINFGTRDLLKGTQFERFLDPNYGQVPEPTQYSQPSNLSYNDLMSILGSKQGMPSASSLSINDIISGIQNQYGQANRSAMG